MNQNTKHNPSSSLRVVNPDAAGIDIGATSHFVAVPAGRDKEIVREFQGFTSDIIEAYHIAMKRTVSIPIALSPHRFHPLMEVSAEIFNLHVDWALENRTYNKSKAHHALYETMKELFPQVPTAFIQSIRDTAMEAVKATAFKKRPRRKKYSGIRFDKRTLRLRGHQLSLSCIRHAIIAH